jgi:CAAX protease family protein
VNIEPAQNEPDYSEPIATKPSARWNKPLYTIRKLSTAAEFALMFLLCFTLPIVFSTLQLFHKAQIVRLTTKGTVSQMFFILLMMLAAACVLHLRGYDLRALGFRFSWRAVLAGVPLTIAAMILVGLTTFLVARFYPAVLDLHLNYAAQTSTGLILAFMLVNSLFEEAAVSGYVVTALSSRGTLLSIGASAFIRTAYHLYYGPIAVVQLLPLGLLFAFVYWKWRNLWPLMTAHTILNIFSLLVAPSLARP